MILEAIFSALLNFVYFIFSFIPSIPNLPPLIISSINDFINFVFQSAGLLGLIFDINLLKVLLPLVLIVINFDKIWYIILWIANKIPGIDID